MSQRENINKWQSHLIAALVFLTRLPLRYPNEENATLSYHAAGFPLAGAVIGVICAGCLMFGWYAGLPNWLAAGVTVLTGIWVTRALHEDGLADMVDGFGGGWSRDQRLEIMRDSHIGAFGVIALIFSIGLRTACITAVVSATDQGIWAAVAGVIAAHALSRAMMAQMMTNLAPARPQGRSQEAGQPSFNTGRQTVLIGLVITACTLIPALGLGKAALAVILCYFAYWWLKSLAERLIGGQTGDVLGACQQVCEIAIWLALSVNL